MTGHHDKAERTPVDAVIMWVDGDDPLLAEKRNSYIKKDNLRPGHTGTISTRFASSNEIRYCVLSILRFASFVRNIFIVTDGQDPELNDEVEKYHPGRSSSIRIVDHREIFRGYEKYLPSFNSTSISTMLWRIEGLSENFVCFSDDVFLVREINYEDWFIENSSVIRGYWRLPPLRKLLGNSLKTFIRRRLKGEHDFQPRISFYIRQWKAAHLLGQRFRYYFHCHTPHPANRTEIEKYFDKEPGVLEKNIAFRFRDTDQFLLTALSYHLEILAGNRNFDRLDLVYIHPYYSEKRLARKINECRNNKKIKFLCVQSLEMLSTDIQQEVLSLMDEVLGKGGKEV